MRPEEIKKAIDQLELSEKLHIVEDIWDSIAAENSEIPMPEWQQRELERRYKNYKEGELQLHDWRLAHQALRDKFK